MVCTLISIISKYKIVSNSCILLDARFQHIRFSARLVSSTFIYVIGVLFYFSDV